MTIFNFIADVLFTKKKNSLDNIDYEAAFSPFMLNRWVSMYNNSLALQCNLLNKYTSFTKQTIYALFINIFQKVAVKKISYFKKKKEENDDEKSCSLLFSRALEISTREIALYEQVLNSLKKQ